MVNNTMEQHMPVGTKVIVKNTCYAYNGRVNGCIGYVRFTPADFLLDKAGIELTGLVNRDDGVSGYFWFLPEDLEVICNPFSSEESQKKANVDPLAIKNVYFNDPVTVVMWEDGTKTIVRCGKNDIYDHEKGLAMTIAKKALGNTGNYYDEFKKWLPKQKEVKPAEKTQTHSCGTPYCSTCCYENFGPASLPCCYCTLANGYKYYKYAVYGQDYSNCNDCKYRDVDSGLEPCASCLNSDKYCPNFLPCDF